MATSATCNLLLNANSLQLTCKRNIQKTMTVSSSRPTYSHRIRAVHLESPQSCGVDKRSLKSDEDDAATKVFADDTKGIVCYRTEAGEVVCEGMDEGPQFYPPCMANFYMPDTRAAAILPLLGEVMYEI
ncbi:hypothetical protein KP509_1Z062200 [Ceratopteris richardii]|nr:hypothetical protein KP509_1Z062200 [Ceratopteris richardii]KAH6558469.1 hypothetical protein KP509_1Z062200 [Ceratopteris richardii]KAH6558470.1 hypothetical protein KP509_1Z062200 [Ceratopteris richardii]KAH6558471.1 hypothetical protein KP509_1Z062200 [Ceratopteris richardii]KAH6558472.1 hypothetical protein KP509_1Z062200 [Ceratopteris richardii]